MSTLSQSVLEMNRPNTHTEPDIRGHFKQTGPHTHHISQHNNNLSYAKNDLLANFTSIPTHIGMYEEFICKNW